MRTSTITFHERGRVAQYISQLPRKPVEPRYRCDILHSTDSKAILLLVMNMISENIFTSQILALSIYLDLYLMRLYIY